MPIFWAQPQTVQVYCLLHSKIQYEEGCIGLNDSMLFNSVTGLGGNIDSHSEFDQANNPHILLLCIYMLQYVLNFVETDVHTINRMFHRSL